MPSPPSCSSSIVDLRSVTKVYHEGDREHRVLDDVSVQFGRGELIVLLGRSGSGKSTLLNLVGGLDRPTSGEVWVDATRLDDLDETARTLFRRRRIGFIFQSYNLIPTLTVLENLLLPLELNNRIGEAEHASARDLLAKIGLEDRADSHPERLSGGEQQRVAIARALAHDPDLLLADEPTGNLDLETARLVLDLLDRLTRQAGKTMIMATHSQEVMGIADRILSVHGGQLHDQPTS